jgi:uncharacterized protein (UPF0335 family)
MNKEEDIRELVERLKAIDLEKIELREAEKELFEEFSDKLNTKAVKIAIRISRMREKLLSEDDVAVDGILLLLEDG